jgi:hypothetical protein
VSVASVRGKGTKITLRIPLTLAIIEGLLVRVGEEHFVVPLSSVDGCIELKRSDRLAAGEGAGYSLIETRYSPTWASGSCTRFQARRPKSSRSSWRMPRLPGRFCRRPGGRRLSNRHQAFGAHVQER